MRLRHTHRRHAIGVVAGQTDTIRLQHDSFRATLCTNTQHDISHGDNLFDMRQVAHPLLARVVHQMRDQPLVLALQRQLDGKRLLRADASPLGWRDHLHRAAS